MYNYDTQLEVEPGDYRGELTPTVLVDYGDPEVMILEAEETAARRQTIYDVRQFIDGYAASGTMNRRIADLLMQEDAPLQKEMADEVGLSITALKGRIHRMRVAAKLHLKLV